MKLSTRLLDWNRRCYHSIFPEEKKLDVRTAAMLARLYPTLEWDKIRFFEGLPWFIFGDFVGGITLPGTYDTSRVHIYLRHFLPNTERGLSTIVHEVFHVLQYHDLGKGRGVGFLRLFLVHYLSNYIKLYLKYLPKHGFSGADYRAYELHPMELPAYKQEYEFRYLYKTTEWEEIDAADFSACICEDSGHENKAGFGYMLLGYLIAGFFMVLKPLVELFLLLVAGVFWVLGKLFGGVGM